MGRPAPQLQAAGDARPGARALGFWKALRDMFTDTKEQRCWWHKIGNVVAALSKSAHKDAKPALAEIYSGRAAILLIVICQCAVARRVAAP